MRVIVSGATTWVDAEAIRRELRKLPPGSTVVHGDSPGVDALAGQVARELGLVVEAFAKQTDDYRHYGRAAWKRLNERMLEAGADLVLAFHPEWGVPGKAKGSGHLVNIAEKQGVEARCFRS